MATDIVAASPVGIGSPPNMASGAFIGSGNPASLILGFNPRHAIIMDETNNIHWEKFQGSSVANSYKQVAAGTQTVDTGSNVMFPADAGLNEPGSTVLLSAAVCASGAKLVWVVYG